MENTRAPEVTREQALAIADVLMKAENAKLADLRERRAKPPSFLYAVPGLRELPASVQEELFANAKHRTIKNWRFVLLATAVAAVSLMGLWMSLQTKPFEFFALLAAAVPGLLLSAASVPIVRSELRVQIRQRTTCLTIAST